MTRVLLQQALDALLEAQTSDDGEGKWSRNSAAIAALRVALAEPQGYVLVPTEPTAQMIAAIPWAGNVTTKVGVACYRAMIAVAPEEHEMRICDETIDLLRATLEENTESEILRAERDRLRASHAKLHKVLSGIYSLLHSPDIVVNDKTFRFVNPDANEAMYELSQRIRAIPNEIAELAEAQQYRSECKECANAKRVHELDAAWKRI